MRAKVTAAIDKKKLQCLFILRVAGTMLVYQSAAFIFYIIAIYSCSPHLSLVSSQDHHHHHHHHHHPTNSEKLHRKLVDGNDLMNFENDRCTTIVVGPKAGSEGELTYLSDLLYGCMHIVIIIICVRLTVRSPHFQVKPTIHLIYRQLMMLYNVIHMIRLDRSDD